MMLNPQIWGLLILSTEGPILPTRKVKRTANGLGIDVSTPR